MSTTLAHWPADTSAPLSELTVGDLLREAAADAPGSVALVDAGEALVGRRRRWTYAELLEQAERVARALGVRFAPGERVAVWAPNVPEWTILEFGLALAGLVMVTVNPASRAAELRHVLAQTEASGIFLVDEYRGTPMAAILEEVRPDLPDLREVINLLTWDDFIGSGDAGSPLPNVTPDDPAQIHFTSGTTGVPKGALLHHRGIVNNARFMRQVIAAGPGDVWLTPVPLFHVGGAAVATLTSLWARATHVPMLRFDPVVALDLVEQERVSIMIGVPTIFIAMMEEASFHGRDLSSVRVIQSGGSKIPPELVRQVENGFGCRVTITYGQTEVSPIVTQTRLDDAFADRAETVGRPFPHVEVKVVAPGSGDTAQFGEIGEIWTRGCMVMSEYYNMPVQTAETIDEDGWLHTGDLGAMDPRGYLVIEGRLRDMIIRGGENIYPREIEEVLHGHPGVADAAVVGMPDDRWGEQVAAFIRPAAGQILDERELFAYLRERLAPHKTPTRWIFRETMPLTPSGKILKKVLRDELVAEGK